MNTLFIHNSELSAIQQQQLLDHFADGDVNCLQHRGDYYLLQSGTAIQREMLEAWRAKLKLDLNVLPEGFDPARVKLLVTDMDSTLITIECIDEIADFNNLKEQVAEITEAAMRGEIDFNESLRRRVALLNGLDEGALAKVYEQRLGLNPGAERLMAELQEKQVARALVSGGFRFFTERLKTRLQLDYTLANTLAVEGGMLTGEVLGEIVNGDVKARFLVETARELGIAASQVIAMGDGANDLPMMAEAGLSVAYHAKPKVQQQADVVLNYSGLDAVLHFLDA